MASDKAIINLIKSVYTKVGDSTDLSDLALSDLGILFSVLEKEMPKKLNNVNDFANAHSVLKYYSYLGSEHYGTVAFDKAVNLIETNAQEMYQLACSYWILFSNSENKERLLNHFVTTTIHKFGSDYTDALLKKLAEQKMPFT